MKKFIYILTIIAITAIVIISMVSCGGSGVNNVIPVQSNPSTDTGSLQINVNWPDKTGSLTSSVIHPDVTQIEITITGTGLSSPRVEVINKPEASKTITGLPEGNKDTEFKGKDTSGTVLSHRKTIVNIIKNQTVTSQAHLGVSILDTGDFYPSSIPISVGDTLYWVNNDDVVHTVTADDSSFDSGDIAAGGEWYRKFDAAGTFGYKCAKTNKAGSVVVGDVVDPNSTPTPVPMIAIPGGTFNMGSNINASENPVHSVTVSSFNMGKYEVTNSEYVLFLNSQGNQTEGGNLWIDIATNQYCGITGGPNPGTFSVVPGYENRPVVYVSWYGAVAYCNWLSNQHGLTPCYGSINNRGDNPSIWRTLNGYRLSTEAEWEYACRAAQTAEYYWGDPYPPNPPNIGNYAWYNGNSSGNHHIVGQLLPNSFGLYDMSGNSVEWCSDWYSDNANNAPNYYVISPGNDPTGPATGSWRVLRSGGWGSTAGECRSANRHFASPDARDSGIGFRLVRSSVVTPDPNQTWGSNVRVDDGGVNGYAYRSNIAVDPSGNAYAIWKDGRNGSSDIYFSYCPAGGSWGANVRVDDTQSGTGEYPSIAVDSSGNAYAVWVDYRNSSWDIYFSYREHATGLWTPNVRIVDSIYYEASKPDIAVDSSGNAYVIWVDDRNDGSGDIYFSYCPAGGSWGTNVRVDDTQSVGTAVYYPSIAVDPSGNAYAIWQDSREGSAHIYFSYRQAGGNWGNNIKVDNEAGFAWSGFPNIAVDLSGNAYAIWESSRSDLAIYTIYSSYRQAGGNWGASERVDDTQILAHQNWYSDIAVDHSGNAYAVWVDMRDSTWISSYYMIYFAYRQAGGNWGTNIKLNNDTYSWRPHIAVTSNGKVYTIWDDRSLGPEHVFSSIRQ